MDWMEKAMLSSYWFIRRQNRLQDKTNWEQCMENRRIEAKRQLCVEKEISWQIHDYIKAFAEDTEIGSCNGERNMFNS